MGFSVKIDAYHVISPVFIYKSFSSVFDLDKDLFDVAGITMAKSLLSYVQTLRVTAIPGVVIMQVRTLLAAVRPQQSSPVRK